MRKPLSLAATAALLVLATGIAKAEAAATLDPSFGKGGKVSLPREIEETWDTVQLADGRIVIPGRDGLLALLPSGQIDSSFGVNGFASLVLPPGATQGFLADLAVDSRGWLVIVGAAGFCTPGESGCADSRSEILVERFNPSGHLDSGFGEGGFVASDFGAPPPTPVEPTPAETVPRTTGQSPSAFARYAAIDSAGRIVISAQRLTGYEFHKGYFVNRYESFVARLEADGKVDTSFASGGVLPIPGSETLGRPLVDAQAGFYIHSFAGTGSTLMHIQSDGQGDPGFGQDGGRPLPKGTRGPVVLDGSGRLLLYGSLQGRKERRLAKGILIKRLRPDGSLDRSFGREGAIVFRMPRFDTAQMSIDEQGRILVGVALKGQSRKGRRPTLPAGLALTRLRPDGTPDRSFSRRGIVAMPFHGNVEMNIESLTVWNGAVLLSAGGCSRASCNRALARVLLGSG